MNCEKKRFMSRKKASIITGLAIEGGGIRSAYVSGVLLALKEKGVTDFDYISGTSAGACCAVNFVTGEPEKNRIILEDYLTSKRFVRFEKVLSRESVMDIDYLIDEVCRDHVPFNLKALQAARSTLLIAATDYHTGQLIYFNHHEHDIYEILRASCAIPYLYRKQAIYRGRRYIDGGMRAPIPVKVLIEQGCQNIIVVGTRHLGYRKRPDPIPAWVHRSVYADSPAVAQAFKERHRHYNNDVKLIMNPPHGIQIHYIAPQSKLRITRITRQRAVVAAVIQQGLTEGREFLAERIKRLRPFLANHNSSAA